MGLWSLCRFLSWYICLFVCITCSCPSILDKDFYCVVFSHLQSWETDLGVCLYPDGQGINKLMLQEWHAVRVLDIDELRQKFWHKQTNKQTNKQTGWMRFRLILHKTREQIDWLVLLCRPMCCFVLIFIQSGGFRVSSCSPVSFIVL